jgi:predicted ABC-type ATPase
MSQPVLHVLVGPNGAGKTTLYTRLLAPVTGLPFVNADVIAAQRWPDQAAARSYDAARLAAADRDRRIAQRRSFVTETVFSHPSKLDLLDQANAVGYRVHLHVVAIPVDLAVARVDVRAATGGHDVPEDKIRARHARLWPLVAAAAGRVDEARIYDNSRAATPYRLLAVLVDGSTVTAAAHLPQWLPDELRALIS